MPVCKTSLYGHHVFLPVLTKANPTQAWTFIEASRRLRLPEFLDKSAHESSKVVSL